MNEQPQNHHTKRQLRKWQIYGSKSYAEGNRSWNAVDFTRCLPFEETLRRNEQKEKINPHNVGELELKKWWREKDFITSINEMIITEEMGFDDIISRIKNDLQESLFGS